MTDFKTKTGCIIAFLVVLISINTLISQYNDDHITYTTLAIHNTWNFYQAKSIKHLLSNIGRYENDPITCEGMIDLSKRADKLNADLIIYHKKHMYHLYTSIFFNVAITILTIGTISINMTLVYGSIVAGMFGIFSFILSLLTSKTVMGTIETFHPLK